jgi:hypothetical protein
MDREIAKDKAPFKLLILLALLPVAGCALFSPTPQVVKDAARHGVLFSQVNEANITYLNTEWHRVLIGVIQSSDMDEQNKKSYIDRANRLLSVVAQRAGPPATINRELSEALSAYLDEPGIGLDRLLGIVQIAIEASKKIRE